MAQWTHGLCIAKCLVCHRSVLFEQALIKSLPGSNWNPYDPMTSVKKHYRLKHPDIFSILFRDMKLERI